jgi:hypothetical protein
MHHVDGLNANAALSAAFRVYQKALHSELLCIVPWCLVTSYECFTFLWLDVALCPEVTYIAAMNATIFTWSVKFFCVLQACGTRIFMEVHGERIDWGNTPALKTGLSDSAAITAQNDFETCGIPGRLFFCSRLLNGAAPLLHVALDDHGVRNGSTLLLRPFAPRIIRITWKGFAANRFPKCVVRIHPTMQLSKTCCVGRI